MTAETMMGEGREGASLTGPGSRPSDQAAARLAASGASIPRALGARLVDAVERWRASMEGDGWADEDMRDALRPGIADLLAVSDELRALGSQAPAGSRCDPSRISPEERASRVLREEICRIPCGTVEPCPCRSIGRRVADAIRAAENAAYERAAGKALEASAQFRKAAGEWRARNVSQGDPVSAIHASECIGRAEAAELLHLEILALRHPDTKET